MYIVFVVVCVCKRALGCVYRIAAPCVGDGYTERSRHPGFTYQEATLWVGDGYIRM